MCMAAGGGASPRSSLMLKIRRHAQQSLDLISYHRQSTCHAVRCEEARNRWIKHIPGGQCKIHTLKLWLLDTHLFRTHSLTTCDVTGPIPEAEDKVMTQDKVPGSRELPFSRRGRQVPTTKQFIELWFEVVASDMKNKKAESGTETDRGLFQWVVSEGLLGRWHLTDTCRAGLGKDCVKFWREECVLAEGSMGKRAGSRTISRSRSWAGKGRGWEVGSTPS